MKPVASGCTYSDTGWRNEDALALQAASDPTPAYDLINPYALPAAVAPEIAAIEAGVTVALEPLSASFTQLRAQADVVVVEGVGGWATPLNATFDQATLVRALEIPVVLVVGLRLGCMNHARLSTAAIMADGLRCIGWIANTIDHTWHVLKRIWLCYANACQSPTGGTYRISPRDKPGDIGHTATSTGGLNHWHAVMLSERCCGLNPNRDHVAIRKIWMPTQLKETVPKVIRAHTMATEHTFGGRGRKRHSRDAGAPCLMVGLRMFDAKYRPDYMADAVRAIDAYMALVAGAPAARQSINHRLCNLLILLVGDAGSRTCDPCRVKAMLYR